MKITIKGAISLVLYVARGLYKILNIGKVFVFTVDSVLLLLDISQNYGTFLLYFIFLSLCVSQKTCFSSKELPLIQIS